MPDEPTDGGTAAGRRQRPAWWWPFVAGASLLSLLLHGYVLHGGDNDAWLPLVQHAAHPELYRLDPFATSPLGRLSYYVAAMGLLTRACGLEWTFLLVYLVAHLALFAVFAELALEATGEPPAAALAVLLLVLPRPIGGTATLTVESSMIPRQLVGCLGILAFLLAMRRRPLACGACLGASMLLHPLSSLPALAAVVGRVLVFPARWRETVRAALTALLVGGAALLNVVAVRADAGPRLSRAEWWDAARQATPFAFVGRWAPAHVTFALTFASLLCLGLAVAGSRRREVAAFLPGAAAFFVAGVGVGEGLHLVSVAALQGGRAWLVVVFLALALAGSAILALPAVAGPAGAFVAGALAVAALAGWWALLLVLLLAAGLTLARGDDAWRQGLALAGSLMAMIALVGPSREDLIPSLADRPARVVLVLGAGLAAAAAASLGKLTPLRTLAAAAVAAVLLLAWVGPGRFEWPGAAAPADTAEAARWARETSPLDARFVAPLDARGFRALAQRAVLVDAMDEGSSLFSSQYAAAWRARNVRFGPSVPIGDLVTRLRAGEFEYLVLPAGAPPVDLPIVHADAAYRIHAAAGPEPSAAPPHP